MNRYLLWVATLIAAMLAFHLEAYVEDRGVTSFEVSPRNQALGEITGVSDAWSSDALGVNDNPALCSLHDGLQWGMLHYRWEKKVTPAMYLNSSYLTAGFHGFGVSLPMLNPLYSDFTPGTRFDYGKLATTGADTWEEVYSQFYDQSRTYSAAIDFAQVMPQFRSDELSSLTHCSIGVAITDIHTRYGAEYSGNATSYSAGFLGCVDLSRWANAQPGMIEGSVGAKFQNIGHTKYQLKSSDYHYNYNLPDDVCIGGSLRLAVPLHSEMSSLPPWLSFPGQHLFTGQANLAYTDGNYRHGVTGMGLELGFLDMLYGRIGSYKDANSVFNGTTGGLGVKLHIGQYVKTDFNYSWTPGVFNTTQTGWDLQFGFDYIKALHL